MKKYLMTGIAALAMCFGFTSCSHDIEPASQEDLNNLEAEQIVNAYNQAFIKTFGQPAANQTWGFGTSATRGITRAAEQVDQNQGKYIDVNGNLWESCPSLGPTEEADVVAYVRSLTTYPKVAPTGLTDYFVTQVHCGTDSYTNADGGVGIVGSSHMNHLQIAMESGGVINSDGSRSDAGAWTHINNFNRGDNTDWNGNTLVIGGGTYNFAYHGTEDSKYHDRWIAINGADIDRALGVNKYAGYCYVCFDFEATLAGYTNVSNIEFYDPIDKQWKNSSNISIPGAWTLEELLASDQLFDIPITHYDPSIRNEWGGMGANVVDRYVTVKLSNQNQVKSISYSNIVGGNMIIEGDNDYTDWIIRLVEAEPVNKPADYDVRIIAEDLNAQATDGDIENSDWDFNDVVFDVNFTSDDAAEITLIAAGGTLPLVVGIVPEDGVDSYPDNEVHALFGVPVNYMVNTNAEKKNLNGGAPAVGHEAPKINFTKTGVKASNGKDIPIYVQKTLKNGTKKWFQLTADKGQPASKLAVKSKSSKFSICDERQDIKIKYPNFKSWVVNNDPLIWWE